MARRTGTYFTVFLVLLAALLALVVPATYVRALETGDGTLLKRPPEETCHACHKTDRNAPSDANSIKSHNSRNTGSTKWGGSWGVIGGKYGEILCTTCHTAHDTSNIYLIRQTITTPDGSNWASTGANGVNVAFKKKASSGNPNPGSPDGVMGADYVSNSTRVCEVCHSQTTHFRWNGGGADQTHSNVGGASGQDCSVCHSHRNGFKGGGRGQAHRTHLTEVYGPKMTCVSGNFGCHGANVPPLLSDGQNLANTTVCDTCHSKNGYYNGVNSVGGSVGAKDNWPDGVYSGGSLISGREKWCVGCHDNAPAVVNGQTAADKTGDNSTYGYYSTGHGRSTTYNRMSWQAASANGNPGANRKCLDCHDASKSHINAGFSDNRLHYEDDSNNSNCRQCHTNAGADPQFYTNYTDYGNSAHNGTKCTRCHDVHGTVAGAYPAMAKDDKESLCYQCHSSSGGVVNNALSNRAGYVSATNIQDAFSKSMRHPLGKIFSLDGNATNFTLECTSCHNVHVVTGKYWDAANNKSPITRFTNNTAVWGGSAGQKMSDYAGSGLYVTPKNDVFTGAQLPNYASFCLDCHAGNLTSLSNPDPTQPTYGLINWGSDPHGLMNAGPSGQEIGLCPNWFSCGKAYGWDGDDCKGGQSEFGSGCWPVIPVGEGRTVWARTPYHDVKFNAQNAVLACIDCHEAHGSNRGSFVRERFNTTDDGGCGAGSNGQNCTDASDWRANCNVCHYHYGQWHDTGPTGGCGLSSCHAGNHTNGTWWNGTSSPHGMEKGGTSSGPINFNRDQVLYYSFDNSNLKDSGTWQLDGKWYSTAGSFAAGKSGQAAVFGPGVVVQVGTEDSYWSTDEGNHGTWKYTEMKYNTTLEAWVKPTADQNYHAIFTKSSGYGNGGYEFALQKIGGTLRAVFYMQADNNEGAQGGAAGVRGAYSSAAIPLNVWTHVAATFDRGGPDRNAGDPSVGRIRIYVNGMDVTTSDSSGNRMQPGASETSIFAYSENSPWNQSICFNGNWCTSEFAIGGYAGNPTYNNFTGMIDEAKVWNITKPISYFDAIEASIAPQIVSVVKGSTPDKIVVTFNKGVYTNNNQTGALVLSDFVFTCSHGKSITGVAHTAGSNTATLTVNPALNYNDINVDTVSAASNQIFDHSGNAVGTAPVTIGGDDGVAPTTSSAVVTGSNKITVTFSEGVYGNTGGTGALVPSDFVYTDLDNGRTITSVTHTAGSSTAILTLSSNLDSSNDIGVDTVAAASNQIFDDMSRAMGTTAVVITGSLCPPVPVTFQLNEASGSATAQDDQGFLVGAVVGSNSFQGDGYYHGSGTSSNYLYFSNYPGCMQATTAMTLEAVIKPLGIPADTTSSYTGRIFAKRNDADNDERYQITVWRIPNATYPSYKPASGVSSIALWTKPVDNHSGNSYKPVLTEATNTTGSPDNYCPIVNNHWYYVKAVFNTNKPAGSGHPVADIYVEDRGTDGNGAGKNWTGLLNCTDSDQSQLPDAYKYYSSDSITAASGWFTIGSNKDGTGNYFNGLIDWIKWQDSID